MDNVDQLTARAVEGVTRLSRRASRFATRLLVGVVVVVGGAFYLGVRALTGGIETVWIVLGIVFGSIAIGAAFIARWRVGAVRRHLPELGDEVGSLLRQDADSGRVVVDTFAVGEDDAGPTGTNRSVMVFGRGSSEPGGITTVGLADAPRAREAIRAFTTLPLLGFLAIGIALVFGFLGFIFLIALAL